MGPQRRKVITIHGAAVASLAALLTWISTVANPGAIMYAIGIASYTGVIFLLGVLWGIAVGEKLDNSNGSDNAKSNRRSSEGETPGSE